MALLDLLRSNYCISLQPVVSRIPDESIVVAALSNQRDLSEDGERVAIFEPRHSRSQHAELQAYSAGASVEARRSHRREMAQPFSGIGRRIGRWESVFSFSQSCVGAVCFTAVESSNRQIWGSLGEGLRGPGDCGHTDWNGASVPTNPSALAREFVRKRCRRHTKPHRSEIATASGVMPRTIQRARPFWPP